MCQGRAATIVGDGFTVGTDGPDVIVARDNASVRAKGGDDVICLVGRRAEADAGPGGDLVDTRRAKHSTVELGAGADSFVGGPGSDRVHGGLFWPDVDTEQDLIHTGAGHDQVHSGSPGSPNRDRISTGRDRDEIHLTGLDNRGSLDVGDGQNIVYYHLDAEAATTWRFDAQGKVIRWDETATAWQGDIAQFYVNLTPGTPDSTLEFLGSGGPDHVTVYSQRLVTRLRLRHGNDQARVVAPLAGGSYELGAGGDSLALGDVDSSGSTAFVEHLKIDLGAGTVDGDGSLGTIAGVENVQALGETVQVLGSARPDVIYGSACDVVADGRGGNDEIRRANFGLGDMCLDGGIGLTTRLVGGPGRDRLVGADKADDILLGGRGYDTAIGRAGTDTCRAEVRRMCENS
jgi:hypothetical protein